MERINIMLCCGAGMSSGFLAKNARKAAKKRGIVASIEARSESEAANYFPSINILLLGPHYAAYEEDMAKQGEPYGVPVKTIPQDIYGSLDGDGLLDFAIKTIEEAKK